MSQGSFATVTDFQFSLEKCEDNQDLSSLVTKILAPFQWRWLVTWLPEKQLGGVFFNMPEN